MSVFFNMESDTWDLPCSLSQSLNCDFTSLSGSQKNKLLFHIESQMLLWQVDQIYDFATFFPGDRGEHNSNLIFCVKKKR